MNTKFEGTVNDVKFTNEQSMLKYVEQLKKNGTSIYEYSYTKSISDCDSEDENNESIESTYQIPEPYKTLEGYLVPKLDESAFGENSEKNNDVLDDLKEKLINRQLFIAKNNIKSTPEIIAKANKKIDWCNKRISELDKRADEIENQISELTGEYESVIAIREGYDQLGGYVSTLID